MSKSWPYLTLVLLFSLLGTKTLFHPGLFTAHDIWHQVVRFYYYSQAISDGQLLPFWVGNLAKGFGYPLFFFSYNLPWLIGTVFIKGGFDIFSSLKILFILSFLGSGFTMYLFTKTLFKDDLAAALSSILYLWLPYHFLVMFVGGSIGIAFVFTFLPLVFLGIHLANTKTFLGVAVLSIGIAGIILSHIMHLVFLFPTILFFFIWEFKQGTSKLSFTGKIIFGLILGILISSFYLLPAAFYNNSIRIHLEGGFADIYKRNFVNFSQLVYSKWGYAPIVNNAKNGEISLQLGIAQWIAIICLSLLSIFKKVSAKYQSLSLVLLLIFWVNIFLMLDFSAPLWQLATKIFILDFPFRLLLPAGFLASICSGLILLRLSKKIRVLIFSGLILLLLYTNRNYINVNQYTNFPISTYLGLETEITTSTYNEYLPINADPKLLDKPWNEIVGENLKVTSLTQTTNHLSFNVLSDKKQTASLGQFYFPGQTLYLDYQKSPFTIDPQGRIQFVLPKGMHFVNIKFEQTPLIKLSQVLSLLGIFTLILLILKKGKLNF